jgi:hypothetical protein
VGLKRVVVVCLFAHLSAALGSYLQQIRVCKSIRKKYDHSPWISDNTVSGYSSNERCVPEDAWRDNFWLPILGSRSTASKIQQSCALTRSDAEPDGEFLNAITHSVIVDSAYARGDSGGCSKCDLRHASGLVSDLGAFGRGF